MDYKEYSRLRSIARKRIERASAAGAAAYVRLPTVKEIRASGDPERYLKEVREFLQLPGSSLRSAKKADIPVVNISISHAPVIKEKKTRNEAERRARRNEQKRRSKAKRAIEKSSGSEAEARKKVGYLKALETLAAKWREAGVDVGNWLGVMSPGMAKIFVNYIEYRFSQGDFKSQYTIDIFIKDFGTLIQKGYDITDIQNDFDTWLERHKKLYGGKKRTNKHGITINEVDQAWKQFVSGAYRDFMKG